MSPVIRRLKEDVLVITLLAFAAFLALALGSYTPDDPSLSSLGSIDKVQNYCGLIGSLMADALYQLFGLGAWFFVLACLHGAVQLWAFKGKNTSIWGAGGSLILLALVTTGLLELHGSSSKFFAGSILIGGYAGQFLVFGLKVAFHQWGTAIILWSVELILLVIYTERSLSEWIRPPVYWITSKINLKKPDFQGLFVRAQKYFNSYRSEAKSVSSKIFPIENDTDSSIEQIEAGISSEQNEEANSPVLADKKVDSTSLLGAVRFKKTPAIRLKVERRIENWKLPELSMLLDPPASRIKLDEKEINRKANILVDKLGQFSVKGEVTNARPGPAVTMYEFKPNADVKISKITELADDLSLALSSESVRIIAPIPGRDVVGIETSNAARETVYLKDSLRQEEFWGEAMKLPITLGRQADGVPRVVDLRKMPHMLVAGTTGSGKSVFVVSLLTGLLFRHSPKTLRLILIDPKQVDLAAFTKVPHLLMPPVCEPRKAVSALKWAVREMDKRYRSMSRFAARGLESYNEIVGKLSKEQIDQHAQTNADLELEQKRHEQYYFSSLPYIVIVVEEFGDLMAVDKVNVESVVVRLAQMARACGIHLVLAMQSPRKDVVTGLIKTNIPGRVSFKVASKTDSRIILDDSGAERLLAQGDLLYLAPGVSKPQRHHAPWVTEAEIAGVAGFWADQGEPQFDPTALKQLDGGTGTPGFDTQGFGVEVQEGADVFGANDEQDDLYGDILSYVSTVKEISASLLQRRFKLGYPRAARLIETFEREGVVGPANGSKPRQVLMHVPR